jgi:hypothetical protein
MTREGCLGPAGRSDGTGKSGLHLLQSTVYVSYVVVCIYDSMVCMYGLWASPLVPAPPCSTEEIRKSFSRFDSGPGERLRPGFCRNPKFDRI